MELRARRESVIEASRLAKLTSQHSMSHVEGTSSAAYEVGPGVIGANEVNNNNFLQNTAVMAHRSSALRVITILPPSGTRHPPT